MSLGGSPAYFGSYLLLLNFESINGGQAACDIGTCWPSPHAMALAV
jgi:hypothetical protein